MGVCGVPRGVIEPEDARGDWENVTHRKLNGAVLEGLDEGLS